MNTRDMSGVWVEDMAGRILGKEMEFVYMGEQLYQELLDLWLLHGNDDVLVAAQLYPAPIDPALALSKTQEAKAALLASHVTHDTFDWDAFRRVANFTRARMG